MNPYLESPDVWSTFHTQAKTAMAERLSIQVRPDYIVHIERQRYVEIRGRHNRALIAIIELLSPANKNPGPDRDQYLAKRAEILAGPAHFVEIDLIRAGHPMPDQDRPRSAYGIMVSRAEERPVADFWPIGIRDSLPEIPVPLRSESYATLDLQEILHHVYDHGTYADEIYESPPELRLDPSDQEWAQQRIPPRHRGRLPADEP